MKHRPRAQKIDTQADKTRWAFYQLTLDWINLRQLPQPANTGHQQHTRTATREYGHPAEWASDKSAEITHILWSWHDMLAEKRNETPPPPPAAAELVRITKAWRYLEPRFEHLVEIVQNEALTEISSLHNGIQRALGYTTPRETLPVPCPGIDCGLRTLQREIGVGRDHVTCGACGYTVRDDPEGRNYRWLIRVCLDTLIDAA